MYDLDWEFIPDNPLDDFPVYYTAAHYFDTILCLIHVKFMLLLEVIHAVQRVM